MGLTGQEERKVFHAEGGKKRPDGGESRLLTESSMGPVWWSRERGGGRKKEWDLAEVGLGWEAGRCQTTQRPTDHVTNVFLGPKHSGKPLRF